MYIALCASFTNIWMPSCCTGYIYFTPFLTCSLVVESPPQTQEGEDVYLTSIEHHNITTYILKACDIEILNNIMCLYNVCMYVHSTDRVI